TVRFRGRVVAATNRPLETPDGRKVFRDDFYYRLCSDVIHVPPLHLRLQQEPNELRELVGHLLTAMLGMTAPAFVAKIEHAIRAAVGSDYRWPGNVRELEQAIRRI